NLDLTSRTTHPRGGCRHHRHVRHATRRARRSQGEIATVSLTATGGRSGRPPRTTTTDASAHRGQRTFPFRPPRTGDNGVVREQEPSPKGWPMAERHEARPDEPDVSSAPPTPPDAGESTAIHESDGAATPCDIEPRPAERTVQLTPTASAAAAV